MDFQIKVFARNMEVTDRIQQYAEKKALKLERYISDIDEVRVDLAYVKSARSATDRHVAQLTVRARGVILRTEERADDIYTAFDAALDKMHRQLERYKGRHHRGRGDGRSAAEVAEGLETEAPEVERSPIVRRKTFELAPMSEAEALEQMKLLGHENFFIFFNIETNSINVLYQRRDGQYGLIEPKIG